MFNLGDVLIPEAKDIRHRDLAPADNQDCCAAASTMRRFMSIPAISSRS